LALTAKTAHALETGLDVSGSAAGFSTKEVDLAASVGKLISYLLGFVGIIFLVLTVYGGFLYMTAQGNVEQTKKARGIIINAAIGLLIVFAAYAITYFIVEAATTVTSTTTT
jgi:hypothetical protein